MSRNIRCRNIRLDIAIAQEIFERKIIGATICADIPEDGWGVYPGPKKNLKNWRCRAEIRPVYVREKCVCKKLLRGKEGKMWREVWKRDQEQGALFKGHFANCLAPVLPYSEEFEYAMEVVKKVKPGRISINYDGSRWMVIFGRTGQRSRGNVSYSEEGVSLDQNDAAEALARASLLYYRQNSQKSSKR